VRGSLKIATVAGIGIYVHWTFLVLLVLAVNWRMQQGTPLPAALGVIWLVVALFACVALHELGHALTARAFGYRTRDITLMIIGGMARIENMPEKPGQEFLVAIAGPAVNVVIAGVLFVLSIALGWWPAPNAPSSDLHPGIMLLVANVMLVLFNLLPAFPMDGGRMLRAGLATMMSFLRATQIATIVGRIMAGIFIVAGLFTQEYMLALIGLFVFFGAGAELRTARIRAKLRNLTVADAMDATFPVVAPHATLGEVANQLRGGTTVDPPVVDAAGRIIGMLILADVGAAPGDVGPDTRVEDVMRTSFPSLHEAQPLPDALNVMAAANCSSAPVLRDLQLVGVISLQGAQLAAAREADVNRRTSTRARPSTGPGAN
jgi:Zn-dependent protease/predicted transcriptional regulator